MKLNNPIQFFPEADGSENFLKAKQRATIVTRGDFIKLYAETDSENPDDWHIEPTSADTWWKMSFDRGLTFPIKMKFEGNSFSASFHETTPFVQDTEITFLIEDNYEELKEGNVRVFENDTDGFKVENKNFKFKFDDSTNALIIKFSAAPIADFESYDVTIKTGIDAQAYGVETPIYSSTVSAIPTVYDSTYGTCNYLDSDISSIECITRLSNVNKLKIKLISADPLYGGSIVLKFMCGSTVFTQAVSVTTSESVAEIIPPTTLNGTLIIERLYTDANDTLSDNGIVISAIITEINMETF